MISISHLPSSSITTTTTTVPRTYQRTHQTLDPQNDYSNAYSNAYSLHTLDLSRPTFENLAALDHQFSADLMQSDSWASLNQFTPKPSRFTHQRESSLSSLGSTGPASPYNQNTSNPQIAVTDSGNETLSDMHTQTDMMSNAHMAVSNHANGGSSYYQLAKTIGPYSGHQSCAGMDQSMQEMAYPMTVAGPSGKPRVDRGLLPAPDFMGMSNRSHPASVTSSVGGDSPATPTITDPDTSFTRRKANVFGNPPKLDRTITDVYSDELYSPNFTITSTLPLQPQMPPSPTNDVFNQRLHAANNQHLSAAHSPASNPPRDHSPFRTGSPHAPSMGHTFGPAGMPNSIQFNSAQKIREQRQAQQESQLAQQQLGKRPEPETPKTISPKDAILEFNDNDGENNSPLFPQDSTNFEMDQFSKAISSHEVCQQSNANANVAGHGQFALLPSQQAHTGLNVPQQYPFIANSRPSHDTPPRLSSAGSSSADSGSNTPVNLSRPINTAADGGTYTCTYHGCRLRFETPSLLQKHKREGHRQTQPMSGPRRDTGMTSALNTQAGPHRCDRINPSTGKPCNTVFSRPYDLTRHEDTIHNARKQKVRCNLCTEEKTFSRADALTRHYRVCHPDVELPGKHRRRG